MIIIDKCGVRGDATLCVGIFNNCHRGKTSSVAKTIQMIIITA